MHYAAIMLATSQVHLGWVIVYVSRFDQTTCSRSITSASSHSLLGTLDILNVAAIKSELSASFVWWTCTLMELLDVATVKSQQCFFPLVNLPLEVLAQVLSKLSPTDLLRVFPANKQIAAACEVTKTVMMGCGACQFGALLLGLPSCWYQ